MSKEGNKESLGGGNIHLSAPRNFGEMTEKELRYLVALLVAGQTEKQIHVKCFIRFTGIKTIMNVDDIYYFVKPKMKGFFKLTSEQVSFFASEFKFLTSRYIGITPFKRIGFYAHPADKLLRDISFAKYFEAENHYQAYIFRKEEKYLVKLLAVLYSAPEKYMLRHATADDLTMCLLWFMGIKEHFARKFKYLFGKVQGNEDEEDGEPIPPNMYEIITNQVRMLTEGDITKNKQVLSSPTWDALTELDNKCREAKENNKQ